MGNCCFRKISSAIHPKNVTILLVGLDNSGKTTIAKRLAGEPIDNVVPTIGFSVLTLRQRGYRVSMYDLGGGSQIRDIWPRYYADVHGVIFVVDASDSDRMEECRQVLRQLLENEQISGKPLLLLANKQDLEGALDEIDVVDRLNLEKMVNELKCPTLVELSSAIQFSRTVDIGLDNGYKWLIRSIMRDYPALNNRVLKDFAKQEEENRVHFFKILAKNEKKEDIIVNADGENSYKPIRKILVEKKQFNEINDWRRENISKIPWLLEEKPDKTPPGEIHQFSEKNNIAAFSTQSPEFFTCNLFQSEEELLEGVANQSFKNFMVRPKSSGARLNGARTEEKKKQKRRQLKKLNKAAPNFIVPIADFSNQNQKVVQGPKALRSGTKISASDNFSLKDNAVLVEETNLENHNPFIVTRNLKKENISERELNIFGEKVSHNMATQASKINAENLENLEKKKYSDNFDFDSAHSKTYSLSKVESFQSVTVNGRMNSNDILLDVIQVKK